MSSSRSPSRLLERAALPGGPTQFSDALAAAVLRFAAARGVPAERVLGAAGDPRAADDVLAGNGWSSYDRFRALTEAAAAAVGGTEQLTAVGRELAIASEEFLPYADMLFGFGTPAGLYRELPVLTGIFAPAVQVEVREQGPGRFSVALSLTPGLAPFPALCAVLRGLLPVFPRLFGHAPAVVDEVTCACVGAARCLFEVAWDEPDHAEDLREALLLRRRAELARMNGLLDAVGRFVSGNDVDDTLELVVGSARAATHALGAVLALEASSVSSKRVYASGLSAAEAHAVAEALLHPVGPEARADGVVAVAGPRRVYGQLCLVHPAGVPTPSQTELLHSYANLAAGALEAAHRLHQARRQAVVADRLLELSTVVADAETPDAVAEAIAAAATDLLDCDMAAVVVRHPDLPIGRLSGLARVPADVVELLQSRVVAVFDEAYGAGPVLARATDDTVGDVDGCLFDSGAVATLQVPLWADDELVGVIALGASDRAERLMLDDVDTASVARLAEQASAALRKARMHAQIHHEAMHDPLTGLPNRTLLFDRAELMLARTRRNRTPGAVLFVDLDGFKQVNDTHGHQVGDAVLRAVAGRLRLTLRTSDTVARVGGDEFCIVVEGDAGEFRPERAAGRVLEALRAPFTPWPDSDRTISISASIGIAVSDGRHGVAELVAEADAAAYAAKAAGRDCVVVANSDAGESPAAAPAPYER